ncbi:MAG: glycoside hydrolase family 27 protein [Terriglobia bacterium]
MRLQKSAVWNHSWLVAPMVMLFIASTMLSLGSADDRQAFILTPQPGAAPRINGPKVYGARPGHPFVYRIPCTGVRPIRFTAEGLPASLRLNGGTGIIAGRLPEQPGSYAVVFHASNEKGTDQRAFKLVVGDTLALTPPMGWNDWYTYHEHITEKVVREAADAIITSGMADFGYAYVDIDGCWTMKPGSTDPDISGAPRDASGRLCPNRRFGDMKALTDYIHAKGLKAGIYSSPGPVDCAGYATSWGHEEADAGTFARWGFDFLKYDWCSYGTVAPHKTLEDYQRPYRLMGVALTKADRDIVFNMCQYGMADVWNWGAEIGGNLWRTTGDLGRVKDSRLPGFYEIGFANAQHFSAARPGHWNDPDYILIGYVGNDFQRQDPAKLTPLTPDEQYSYMSMWALMASPLFFSGAMDGLDPFTLNVLCNSEVIDIDQDSLGKQARIVRRTADEFVLAKPLEDGGLAVGLFNLADTHEKLTVKWEELGLKGRFRVRDAWRQKDLGAAREEFSSEVGPHGVALIRLTHVD